VEKLTETHLQELSNEKKKYFCTHKFDRFSTPKKVFKVGELTFDDVPLLSPRQIQLLKLEILTVVES
jgi:hypothetical protein